MSGPADDAWLRARIEGPRAGSTVIERVGELTGYLVQTIVEDALSAGPGATVALEWPRRGLRVPGPIARLSGRGITVASRTIGSWRPPVARARAA